VLSVVLLHAFDRGNLRIFSFDCAYCVVTDCFFGELTNLMIWIGDIRSCDPKRSKYIVAGSYLTLISRRLNM
jgi:hypothetical protein